MICHVRPIPSCPGYFVSDTGRVWGPRKELRFFNGTRGYLVFAGPRQNGRRQKSCFVHHVVAEAFVGPKPLGVFVCHHNDKRHDNRAENLYYGNASTNALDAFRNGRSHALTGEEASNAKLTRAQVESIRRQYATGGITQKRLAKNHGVSFQNIHEIVHHHTWKEAK